MTETKPPIESPLVNRDITYRPAEHEIFLSFTSDWHAAAFADWWASHGESQWRKFAEKNREDYL